MAEVELICDRAIILHEGVVRAEELRGALRQASPTLSQGFFKLLEGPRADPASSLVHHA